jgi:hypothetical protein
MLSRMTCQYVHPLAIIHQQLSDLQKKNRYVELIRVSRQMRKLQNLKHFGAVYNEPSTLGSLTIFCPSCPQPGINLPPDWKNLPNWVTRRTITVDGNFHADHIKMRRPDLDVVLTNGQGFMVEDKKYMEYLSVVKEPCLVCKYGHILFLFLN